MIVRHTNTSGAKATFFSVQPANKAEPQLDQVSPPSSSRGRAESLALRGGNKPAGKPYRSFPLTPHRSGQFCKKIRGKIFYFGKVDNPDAALKRYHEHCRDLHSGKSTRVERTDEITVAELANRFLAAKDRKREIGDIEAATFVEYHRDCELFVTFFGKGCSVPSITRHNLAEYRDFLSRGANATTLSNRVGNARSIFKFAYDKDLIDKPVRFGDEFKRPERRVIRRAKAKAGRMHFLADEIRLLITGASPGLRAMILLGINCGLGNKDVGNLPASSIDLERGWLDYPRGKTGVTRRCPLWPETVEAIRESIALCNQKKIKRQPEAVRLLFVTRSGMPCVRENFVPSRNGKPHIVLHDVIKTAIQRALARERISQKGLGFYGLRRSFETIGGETGNQVAVDHVMGHAPLTSDMGAIYRQHVAESALRQVTDHVHDWLFGKAPAKPRRQK